MTRRRTEITVETERLLVAHRRQTTRIWCVRCGLEVETVAGTEDGSPNGTAQSGQTEAAAGRKDKGPARPSGESSPRS